MELIRSAMFGGDQRLNHFRLEKAIEVVGLLILANDRSADYYYINKLAYLAERESLIQYNYPLFFDSLNSLPLGPIASKTKDKTYSMKSNFTREIGSFISATDRNTLVITGEVTRDELSNSEISLILDVKKQADDYIKKSLKKFNGDRFAAVHDYVCRLPEYVQIKQTDDRQSLPIFYETILSGAGYTESSIKEIIENINSSEMMQSV